jgi:hypothetical protein
MRNQEKRSPWPRRDRLEVSDGGKYMDGSYRVYFHYRGRKLACLFAPYASRNTRYLRNLVNYMKWRLKYP